MMFLYLSAAATTSEPTRFYRNRVNGFQPVSFGSAAVHAWGMPEKLTSGLSIASPLAGYV
jgi:hypothetical protein